MIPSSIVVKIGGSTLGAQDTTAEDLVWLQRTGALPVVVHGGGQIISQWTEQQGVHPRFVSGLRVTDSRSLEVVIAVLSGLVNKHLVATILRLGGTAIGLSGVDGRLIEATIADRQLGLVGKISRINLHPLLQLLEAGYLPLVAPIGFHAEDGSNGSGVLNINGDSVAGELAKSLHAQSLIFLTDVEGVLDTGGRVIKQLTLRQAHLLLTSGTVKGGMIPKLEACINALEQVPVAYIVDGRKPGALRTCVSGQNLGTVIQNRSGGKRI